MDEVGEDNPIGPSPDHPSEKWVDEGDRLDRLRDKNRELARRVRTLESALQSAASGLVSIEGLGVMVLRVSFDDKILYVNQALCEFLEVEKKDLEGQDLKVLGHFNQPWLLKCARQHDSEGIEEFKGDDGSAYNIQRTVGDNHIDIVIRDESEKHRYKNYINKYIGQDLTRLDEEDLSTFRFPERRHMSVSFTDLRGFTAMSEAMTPEEVRTTINAYLEEMIYAIELNGATIDKIVGDNVMALYGAPKYYEDHALRALVTAVDQMMHLAALQKVFGKMGKLIPDCGIAIHTGEMVVGNMGSVYRQDYTVLGSAVNLTSRLCNLAQSKQIVTSEETLKSVLSNLPIGWSVREEKGDPAPLPDEEFRKVENLLPLASQLRGKVVHIGPDGENRFTFKYLYSAKVKGIEDPLPIVEVEGLARQGELALKESKKEKKENDRIFGPYRLITLIGKGGMGEVWRARDRFGNTLAIKMLLAGEMASETQTKRFKNEAQAMAMLQHRNICRIYEVGEIEGITYIAMENIRGVTLSDLLSLDTDLSQVGLMDNMTDLTQVIQQIQEDRSKSDSKSFSILKKPKKALSYRVLPEQQTLNIIERICDAIQFVHERGILHRDLKPSNIMIRVDGDPVVMDFGLAKMSEVETDLTLSLTGQIRGTIEHMAPEQARSNQKLTERADVFSIGTILYQMITGKKHFETSGNVLNDANQLQHHEPIPPRRHQRNIDNDLEVITLKALRPDPLQRYASARNLKEDLDRYRRGEVIHAQPVRVREFVIKWFRRNRAVALAIAIVILTLIFSGATSYLSVYRAKVRAEENLSAYLELQAQGKILQGQLEAEIQGTRQWVPIVEEDFSTVFNNHQWSFISWDGKGFVGEEAPEIKDGELMAQGGEGQLLIFKEPVHGDIRLEFTIRQVGEVLDGVGCFMSAREMTDKRSIPQTGYELKHSAVGNTRDMVMKGGHLLMEQVSAPLIPGKTYHVAVERVGKLITMWVNDQIIMEIHDPKPLRSTNHHLLGLSAGKNLTYWDNIKLFKLAAPIKVDLLEVAESHRIRKNYDTALGLYNDILDASLDNNRLKKAQEGKQKVARALLSKERLMKIGQSLSMMRFQWPNTKVTAKEGLDSLAALHLKGGSIENFRMISDLPVEHLILESIDISDLSEIKKMPLKKFRYPRGNLDDLSFLRGLDLDTLLLNHHAIRDLSPLTGMPLRFLSLRYNEIEDISVLYDMPLETLDLEGNHVSNPSPILQTAFHSLNMSGNPVGRMSGLNTERLKRLMLGDCDLISLSFLRRADLKLLIAPHNRISSLQPLEGMMLDRFDLNHNEISDISPLSKVDFIKGNLSHNRIVSLKGLEGKKIKQLNLQGNQIEDLRPLEGNKLDSLNISDNPIEDLSSLRSMPLRYLNLSGTRVKNLEPISKHQFKELDLSRLGLENLTPLRDFNVEGLVLDHNPISTWDKKLLQGLKKLSMVGVPMNKKSFLPLLEVLPEEFYFGAGEIDPELLTALWIKWEKDAPFLFYQLSLHRFMNGHREGALQDVFNDPGPTWIYIPWQMSKESAQAFSKKLGGTLVEHPNSNHFKWLKEKWGKHAKGLRGHQFGVKSSFILEFQNKRERE